MSLINTRLRHMNWGGYNPRNRTKFRIVLGFLVWFITFLTWLFDGIYLITNTYTDFGLIIIDLVLVVGMLQMVMKIWTLFAKHRSLHKLINLTEYKFWSLDALPLSERPDIQNIYNIAKLAVNFYVASLTVCLIGHFITAYFRGSENLINNVWLPKCIKEWNRTPLGHHAIFLIEGISFSLAVFSGFSEIDGIFIICIASVIGQLRILRNKIMSLNERRSIQENMQQISECVEHHNLLFEYLQTMDEMFSMQFLQLAGTFIFAVVLTMYVSMRETDVTRKILYLLMGTVNNGELFIYCYAGQLIQDETLAVADAAYFGNWENIPDKQLRHSLMFIILRSHKYVNMSMGGMFILCLETFTQVSKMMFSLLTFMLSFDIGK